MNLARTNYPEGEDRRHRPDHPPTPDPTPATASAGLHPADIPTGGIGISGISRYRLLPRLDLDLTHHTTHQQVHGELPDLGAEQLVEALTAAPLLGRGGAGHPVAHKLQALHHHTAPVIVVNGAEGEPASAKDHVLLARAPHLVLDGATLLTHAYQASQIIIAVTDPRLTPILTAALAQRGQPCSTVIRVVPDRYLSGESHALINNLNGGNGLPPGRPVHATHHGVGGAPTLLFNTETHAQLALLARTHHAHQPPPHTSLVTVSGAVANPGVYEIPAGTPLRRLNLTVGAHHPQTVIIGGYHGNWVTPNPHLTLHPGPTTATASPGPGAAHRAHLGAGVIAYLGADTCPLAELTTITGWLADQSAHQCGPCTHGLPTLTSHLTALHHATTKGEQAATLALLKRQTPQVRGACHHPVGAAHLITSALPHLQAELDQHRDHGHCGRPHRHHLPLTRTAALTTPHQQDPTPRTGPHP